MRDIKEWTQERAEELSECIFGKSFAKLTDGESSAVYGDALEDYKDYVAETMDYIYERERDRRTFEGKEEDE